MESVPIKIKASHVYANPNNIISCSLEGDVITIVTTDNRIEYTIGNDNSEGVYTLIVRSIQETIAK